MEQEKPMEHEEKQPQPTSTESGYAEADIHPSEGHSGMGFIPQSTNPFLQEFIDTVKNEIEEEYHKIINRFFVKEVDIQQNITITKEQILKELDIYQRKLFLMAKAGVKLSATTYTRMGFYFLVREFYHDGLELIEQHIEEIDDKDIAYNLLGIFYYRLGELEKALALFHELSKLNTDMRCWKYSMGIIHYMLKNYREALDQLIPEREKYAERPNFLLCVGNCYYFQQEYSHALKYLEKYNKLQPNTTSILERLALITYELQIHAAALHYIQQVNTLGVTLPNQPFKMAVLYYHQGDHKKAALQLLDLLNFDKSTITTYDNDLMFGLFMQAYEMKVYDKHIFSIFKALLADDPSDQRMNLLKRKSILLNNEETTQPDQLLFRAHINMLLGQYDHAEYNLKLLVQHQVQTPEILSDLCKVLFIQGKKEEGLDLFNQLHSIEALDGEVHFWVAEAFYDLEQYKESLRSLQLAIKKDFKTADLYNLMGFCYFTLGHFQEAVSAYQWLVDMDPDDKDARNDLGIAYTKLEAFEKAIEQFKYILQRDPDNKEAHFNLNQVYRLILEKEAEDHYGQYVELTKS